MKISPVQQEPQNKCTRNTNTFDKLGLDHNPHTILVYLFTKTMQNMIDLNTS